MKTLWQMPWLNIDRGQGHKLAELGRTDQVLNSMGIVVRGAIAVTDLRIKDVRWVNHNHGGTRVSLILNNI